MCTLQRVVLPFRPDAEILPLYVAADPAPVTAEHVMDRRRLLVPAGCTASFGTYFNAFPAGYWRHWTTVGVVELRVQLTGAACLRVFCSDAAGRSRLLERQEAHAGLPLVLRVPLDEFGHGGWCWFEVTAGERDVVLESAQWCAPHRPADVGGTIAVALTTLNRPAYVLDVLRDLAKDGVVLDALGAVVVVDQGDQRVRDEPGFGDARDGLGGRLRVLEQENLGGSGGFARGMTEASSTAHRYVLLLDDDVVLEPEGILRAAVFAELCRVPTIVGGHMLDLVHRSRLYRFGEVVRRDPHDWGPADGVQEDHDLAAQSLLDTPWMHRRVDVDYTAWWMCLIPARVLRELGLPAPFFIGWDDAEYGLRAARRGYPTVTLPGAAVWHLPFTSKTELSDWKVYFQHRNRLITAMTHQPDLRGRTLTRESFTQQLACLLSMRYAEADLRLTAVQDLLAGPAALHPALRGKLDAVMALRGRHTESAISHDLRGFPAVRDRVLGKDEGPRPDALPAAKALCVVRGALRQLRAVPPAAEQRPQALIPTAQAVPTRLALLDSALVWTRDGEGVRLHRRDRSVFLRLLVRTVQVHLHLLAQWPVLRRRYSDSWAYLTSEQAWARSLHRA